MKGDCDTDMLKALLEAHVSTPGSKVASFILGDYENQLRNFVLGLLKGFKKMKRGRKAKIKP